MDFSANVFDRLDAWTNNEMKPGEMGRILALLLTLIVISFAIVGVARIMVSLAIPTLVIVALLMAYHIVTPSEIKDALMDVPDILTSCTNFISGLFCKLRSN
ncbi:uncharacterized protein LOC6727923 [Drosophila simulans]|uniref:GD19042 n=1 Tax=Drosophila simulans TaxID=7240 RepID=B4QXV7_DROSI|nr:uncharacterized protein LOC6727923 [Drosophila simulans]EDX12781.1 GD19042 [Drosophila simulans]KMZ03352.1 uncharacterized protein Dsimw501_GD19042 [Drosophila simulans]